VPNIRHRPNIRQHFLAEYSFSAETTESVFGRSLMSVNVLFKVRMHGKACDSFVVRPMAKLSVRIRLHLGPSLTPIAAITGDWHHSRTFMLDIMHDDDIFPLNLSFLKRSRKRPWRPTSLSGVNIYLILPAAIDRQATTIRGCQVNIGVFGTIFK
jgi:hypothetical protein